MGKTIFYIVFSCVQEERHDGTGMKSEKGINKNGTGMVK